MATKITNCHTHIFTGDQVPPLLGKTLIPWPFYHLANIKLMIAIVRSTKNGWMRAVYFTIKTPVDRFLFWYQGITEHVLITKIIAWIFKFIITSVNTLFMLSFLRRFFVDEKGIIRKVIDFVFSNPVCVSINTIHWMLKVGFIIISIIFIKWVRNIARLMLFAALKFLKEIMGSGNVQLLKRYYNIALLCRYKNQKDIFEVLRNSYPINTNFVVLPMDLDYIKAGKAKQGYLQQLAELIKLKQNPSHDLVLKPFVFADPRRIAEQPVYYDTIIDCLENKGFSGIKIYPALGYYPFDKHLLELFLYACQKQIPILTHCIRGIIFYRGLKKKEWDEHPVFTENDFGVIKKLRLKEFNNIDFINNFTHPLNYLCLLDPKFLKIVLFNLETSSAGDTALAQKLYSLYGYTKNTTPENSELKNDLRNLKLCFGHFGGEDEWAKYIERDRNDFDNSFVKSPLFSQDFKNPIYRQWNEETWYSIIRSIIMNPEYQNVYADISFIIYDEKIISLLKSSLAVPHLRDRILYGTDFYVVRQKGTDKKFWTDIQAHLSPNEIKLIAQDNPATFIK
jgi:hypothetical protein